MPLSFKAPRKIAADDTFIIFTFIFRRKQGLIFHDLHEISSIILSEKQ